MRAGEWGMIRRYGFRRIRHLLSPGRRERERAAQQVVSKAAHDLLAAPITSSGLNLRQMDRVMSLGLKFGIEERILFGPGLRPDELDRLINETDAVRAEFPEMFE